MKSCESIIERVQHLGEKSPWTMYDCVLFWNSLIDVSRSSILYIQWVGIGYLLMFALCGMRRFHFFSPLFSFHPSWYALHYYLTNPSKHYQILYLISCHNIYIQLHYFKLWMRLLLFSLLYSLSTRLFEYNVLYL